MLSRLGALLQQAVETVSRGRGGGEMGTAGSGPGAGWGASVRP